MNIHELIDTVAAHLHGNANATAKLEADARALWAVRVFRKCAKHHAEALHIPGDRAPDLMFLPIDEADCLKRAEALVAAHPELDPDAHQSLKSP